MTFEFFPESRRPVIRIPSRWSTSELLYFSCYWLLFAFVAPGWIYGWYLIFIEVEPPDRLPHLPAIIAFCLWLVWLIVAPFRIASMFWPIVGESTLEISDAELTHRWKTPLCVRQKTYPASEISELRPHYYRTLRYSAVPWGFAYSGHLVRKRDFECDRATLKFFCKGKTQMLPIEFDVQEAKLAVETIVHHGFDLVGLKE